MIDPIHDDDDYGPDRAIDLAWGLYMVYEQEAAEGRELDLPRMLESIDKGAEVVEGFFAQMRALLFALSLFRELIDDPDPRPRDEIREEWMRSYGLLDEVLFELGFADAAASNELLQMLTVLDVFRGIGFMPAE
ncbi:MAG: hypothetical protein FJW86_12845 [Actinobacteria bacterium]|nr:hypothetical protein [Actinomycetota bacterium]